MTAPVLFSGPFFSALGWALFHFLWQGALVALLFGALSWLIRERSPTVRYVLSCGALTTMLVLPIATGSSLLLRASRSPAERALVATPSRETAFSSSAAASDATAIDALLPSTFRSRLEAWRPWALAVWFAGVLLLSVRFLGGLAAARRMTRRGTRAAPRVWQEALARIASRLAITRPVRLLESAVVRVPTAIGAFRPVILFPATVFLGLPTRGLEALIAHELAHVRRHDYLVNLLQAVVETVLFYHPAVWWVSARVRAEREQCCDDLAIAATGDARTYARALMRLEEMRGSAPALALAAGGGNLWKRVVRLLVQSPAAAERPSAWVAGAVALAMLAVLGSAARVGPAGGRPEDPFEASEPDVVVHAPAIPAERSRPEEPATLAETPVRAARETIPDVATIAEVPQEADAAEEATPPVEPATRVLTDDELAAFRNQGVTADYVRSIAELGYASADPDDILALRIHGVTPRDIAELNRVFGRRPLDEHVSFKIHGVTPEEVRRLNALRLGKLSPDDVLSMKIHGIDAAYVERLRAGGYKNVSAEDAVSAKIHGVQPGDAEAWSLLGYAAVSLEDLVAARIHGASPEFAAEVRAFGFSSLSLEDLVSFRIHGVTAEFLRKMKSVGFSPPAFSADDAVSFRIHGVTPEFAREIRSLGYSDVSPDDLVDLRIHGITADQIRKENSRSGRPVPLEDLVERYTCGKESDDEN